MKNACRRDAPSVIADISMSQGTPSKNPFMMKIANGSSRGADDEDDPGDRVEHPGPVHEEEDRDDEGHRGKGVEHEQGLKEACSAGEREA